MSRLRFHSPAGYAEVMGSEQHLVRKHVYDLATGLLSIRSAEDVDRLLRLVEPGHYLHDVDRTRPGWLLFWAESFKTALRTGGKEFSWHGHPLDPFSITLNTVLAVGNDSWRLVARMAGQNEIHAWVDGPNRKWLAGLIDDALEAGLLRHNLRPSGPFGEPEPEQEQGWSGVLELLRSRDDEPVVTSYSTNDSFPVPHPFECPPPMPNGWVPAWVETDEERAEWDEQDDSYRMDYWEESVSSAFFEQPEYEQWAQAMRWLRSDPGRLELRPDDWCGHWFGNGLTVFDLNAEDWERRLDEVLGLVLVVPS